MSVLGCSAPIQEDAGFLLTSLLPLSWTNSVVKNSPSAQGSKNIPFLSKPTEPLCTVGSNVERRGHYKKTVYWRVLQKLKVELS